MITLRWLKNRGGIAAIEVENDKKAALMYETIDALPLYKGTVVKEDRSRMNACFIIEDKQVEEEFLALCKAEGMIGVKGHRSVGGFRVSMYNAMPYEGVVALADLMKYFATKKG